MSFFRLAIYICIGLILLSLFIGFIDSLGAFPVSINSGISLTDRDNVFYQLTGLTGGWAALWTGLIGIGLILAVPLAIAIGSFIPIGIYLFGVVFWTSYTRAYSVLNIIFNPIYFDNGSTPSIFLLIIDVIILFIFIAACLGMSGVGE